MRHGARPAEDVAFTEFAVASRPRLRSTAYLLCGDGDRASDPVQEAWGHSAAVPARSDEPRHAARGLLPRPLLRSHPAVKAVSKVDSVVPISFSSAPRHGQLAVNG